MGKNVFQRFVDKAALNDDYDSYEYDSYDDYQGEDVEQEAPEVSPLRSVAPAPEISRIVTMWPRTLNDVKGFADEFRKDVPVILNLSGANNEDLRRIVDFALGMCYGLGGTFNEISDDVFLLTPHSVKMDGPQNSSVHPFS